MRRKSRKIKDKNTMRQCAFNWVLPLFLLWAQSALGEEIHQNSRCNCKCPDVSTIGVSGKPVDMMDRGLDDKDNHRSTYIDSSVTPDDCDCKHVVIPVLNLNETQAKAAIESFCPRCQCKYQVRYATKMPVCLFHLYT